MLETADPTAWAIHSTEVVTEEELMDLMAMLMTVETIWNRLHKRRQLEQAPKWIDEYCKKGTSYTGELRSRLGIIMARRNRKEVTG
jgi:hypothetical protein